MCRIAGMIRRMRGSAGFKVRSPAPLFFMVLLYRRAPLRACSSFYVFCRSLVSFSASIESRLASIRAGNDGVRREIILISSRGFWQNLARRPQIPPKRMKNITFIVRTRARTHPHVARAFVELRERGRRSSLPKGTHRVCPI